MTLAITAAAMIQAAIASIWRCTCKVRSGVSLLRRGHARNLNCATAALPAPWK